MNRTWHSTLSFLKFNIEQYIVRKKWLIVLPIYLFIVYIEDSKILVLSRHYNILSPNTWDSLFGVLSNGNSIFLLANFLFLFLISDISVETSFGELILFRLQSRSKWWLGKILTLALATLIYAGIILVIIGGVSSFVFPWGNLWSEMAKTRPLDLYLNPDILRLSPLGAFLRLATLLILGWFSLGLVTIVASALLNNAIIGFLVGVIINVCGIFGYKGWFPHSLENFSIHTHFLLNFHSFGEKNSFYPPYFASIIYWVIWIALFTAIGFLICKKKDFLLGHVAS